MGANKLHTGLIWVIYSRNLGSGLGTFLYPCIPLPSFGQNPKEKQLFFVKLSLTRASIILCLTSWTILMIWRMVLLRAYKRGHFLSRRERPPQEDLCLLIFIRERNCFNLMLSLIVKKERLYWFKNTLSLFQKDHYAACY